MPSYDAIKNLHLRCLAKATALKYNIYKDTELPAAIQRLIKAIARMMQDNKKRMAALTGRKKAALQAQNKKLLIWREHWLEKALKKAA